MRLKLSVVLIFIAILTISYGAAALTSVSLDRDVSAGTVLVDTDANVAVKFEALTGYTTFLSQSGGKVSFDLSKAINDVTTRGYNTESQFTIGNAASSVFRVTNNSELAITISLNGVNGLKMYDVTDVEATTISPRTINPGLSSSFYFKIDTAGVPAGSAISGTIQVRT